MSECVVRMEMPRNCCECQLRQEDYDTGEEFCPFTGVECLSIGIQDNCPIICSLPEGHGRLVDATKIDFVMFTNEDSTFRCGWNNGVRSVMQHAETIVPAERSET